MLANFFNKTKPINILSIISLLLVYYIITIFSNSSESIGFFDIFEKLAFFLLYGLIILTIDFIVKRNRLTHRNSYALILFVIFIGSFPEIFNSSNLTISNLILLFGFRKIYSLKSEKNIKKKLFDAGFWIAIATLIYFWSILHLILVYIAIIVFKKLTFKNLAVPIIGAVTPLFLYFAYNDFINESHVFFDGFNTAINLDIGIYNSLELSIPTVLFSMVLLWSLIIVTPNVLRVNNKLKSSWIVVLIHLVVALIVVQLAPDKNGSELIFLFFPGAIIIANFIQKEISELLKNVILFLFLLASIAVYVVQ
jgi:hypothetical protein